MARRRTPEERREQALSTTRALIRLCTYTKEDLSERIAIHATMAAGLDKLADAYEAGRQFDVTAGAKRGRSRSINRSRWDAETERQESRLYWEALREKFPEATS